jgi:hypothetical protein
VALVIEDLHKTAEAEEASLTLEKIEDFSENWWEMCQFISSRRIIGIWTDKGSTLRFFKDGTFEEYSSRGSKSYFRGEYVTVESGVFLRYFGSMHWPKTGSHEDMNTSIGAHYLRFEGNDQLINEQEDYSTSYEKMPQPIWLPSDHLSL